MKKQLFLHIGSHKTATTFLQNTLSNNRAVLDDLGILYPESGRVFQAHFKLSRVLNNKALEDDPLEALGDWPALFDEIDASPHRRVVISAEEFTFRFDPARLAPLRERYDVRIIYYLRSPEGFLESFYNQFVKDFNTRETRTLQTYMTEEDLFFLDPMMNLRPWAEVFGKEAISLRLFGREFLKDGILADFLGAMGCTSIPEFAPAGEMVLQKASLAPDVLEYLRMCNRWLTLPDGHYDFVIGLVKMSQDQPEAFQQTRAGILSLKARQALRKRFRHSSRLAAQNFLGADRTPFPPDQAAPPPADFDTRLAEITPEIMGRIATLIQQAGSA